MPQTILITGASSRFGAMTAGALARDEGLIEEVPDGGYGRADSVFVVPEAHRARDG